MKASKKRTKGTLPWKSIISIVLCVLMLGSLLTGALVTMVSAASSKEIKKVLDDLKNQAQEIANQSAALEKELGANKSKTQTTIEQKSDIDKRIHMTEVEIQNVNAQIQQYSLLIAQKQSELEDALKKQSEMNETYKTRLRAMEESGSVSYWSILFKSNSFSDLLSRIDSIREVAEADQRMLKEMQAVAEQIELDRQDLEAEMTAQEAAKTELAQKEQELQAQRAEADKLLLELAAAYDSLNEEFLANEAQEEELRKDIMARQAEYEKALSAEEAARLKEQNKNNVAGGGSGGGSKPSGFVAPLNVGLTVTSAFGWRNHPTLGYRRFHYGVDLAAAAGTPIYAIASGTVTTAAYGEANGYYVALAHGGGYGSIYCHMTNYVVKAGDQVSQGQVIGYVGSTGWSTGPHLHFEIHVNGSAVNPMDYIG